MFGDGYYRMESIGQLPAGHYDAKIIGAELKNGTYGQQMEVLIYIEGHGNDLPNKFWLSDAPKQGNGSYSQEELFEMWCRNMTKFFDSFGIPAGDFNVMDWKSRVGRVTVRPQKKNPQYMEIIPYETKIEQKQTTTQAQPQQSQYVSQFPPQNPQPQFAPNPQFQQARQPQQPQGFPNFQEDVPF